MKIIFSLFLAVFFFTTSCFAQKLPKTNDGAVKTNSRPIIGLNQNWSYFPSLENGKMVENIKKLAPEMIRYPGGTVTHSWDWRKGIITTRKANVTHPVSDVKKLSDATGARVVFVLDIVNSTVEDQIEMLRTAQRSGVAIEYVELGNELYARDKGYENKFPTGADYAKAVNDWTPKLKAAFPKAKVAALLLARAVTPQNKRAYEWDSQIIAKTKQTVDAYTYHIYIGEAGGTFPATKQNFENVVKRDNLGNKEIWITEYGVQKEENDPLYLKELEQLADFIESFPNVTIALNHQIVGNNKNKLTADGNDLTPEGEMFVKRAEKRKAASPVSQNGNAPISPQKYQAMLGKGMDVNWANFRKNRDVYSEKDVIDFKQIGLSHVRVRVKENIDEQLLREIDQVIKDCLKNDLIPIIAYQADDFKDNPSDENLQKTLAWWKAVAERFKNTSHLVSFDLIVEVTDALNKNQPQLDKLYEQTVAEIRKTNPMRIIFISPRVRSAPEYLNELKIPSKANGYLMAEWHFYASGPSKTNPVKLWTTGTPAEKQILLNKFKIATDWSKKTGIPTWVGAWMPGNYNEENNYTVAEQIVFARFVTCELGKAGVPHAFNADIQFYDSNKKAWLPDLLPVAQEIINTNCGTGGGTTPTTSPSGAISPQKYQTMLGRGLDVDWSKTGKGKESYNEQTVKDFKQLGLTHVRIRVTEDTKTNDLGLLEKQVNDCLKHGLIPVVAFQANTFKEDPSDANLQKSVAWWKAVAEKFKNTSHQLSFDLIIEVSDALNKNQPQLNKYFEAAVTEIRKTNPTRILFISPRVRSAPEYLNELKIPTKANGYLMAEWHFYASGPSKTNPEKLWTTGTPAEKQILLNKFKAAMDWSKKNGIPTWVGAWMPGDYVKGKEYSIAEQIVFARFVTCELSRAGIPFSINSDTKFYDRDTNRWIPEMQPLLKEILQTNCK